MMAALETYLTPAASSRMIALARSASPKAQRKLRHQLSNPSSFRPALVVRVNSDADVWNLIDAHTAVALDFEVLSESDALDARIVSSTELKPLVVGSLSALFAVSLDGRLAIYRGEGPKSTVVMRAGGSVAAG
jgi:hypothetical protein